MAQVATRSSDRDWPSSVYYSTSTTLNRQQQQLPPPHSYLPPVQHPAHYQNNVQNYPQEEQKHRPSSPGLRTPLAAWGLPTAVVSAYASKGITTLFPWQAAALEGGEDGHNLVYCAPTSGGKSLVADILMIRKMIGLGNRKTNHNIPAGNLDSALMPPPPPQQVQQRGMGRALVVLPYISIVSEKTDHLNHLLRPIRATVRGYYSSMDSQSSSPLAVNGEAVAVCTIEKANVCINRLIQEGRLGELCCIVIDELHMIANPQRGTALELLLTKILHQKESAGHIQIIGMSATMGGLESLRKWLRARLFLTNYRPVPLTEYAVFNGTVYSKINNKPNRAAKAPAGKESDDAVEDYELGSDSCPLQLSRVLPPSNSKEDPDRLLPLVSEVTTKGHSVLIFCGTRRNCEVTAAMVAKHLESLAQGDNNASNHAISAARQELISQIEDAMSASLSPGLGETILAGVAWHHAGLSQEEKAGIEAGYRSGTLQVLAATSTLAAGVNLPARRVILRSNLSFGRSAVDRAMYLQMVGRAGRAGQSPVGEAYIIGGGSDTKQKNWVAVCKLITAPVPILQSQLLVNELASNEQEIQQEPGQGQQQKDDPSSSTTKLVLDGQLQRLLVESVANGAVSRSVDVQSLLQNTFAAHQHPWVTMVAAARNALRVLQKEKRLLQCYGDNGSFWKSTNSGIAVYDSALPLDAGLELFNELRSAEKGLNISEPLHAIFLTLKVVKSANFIKIYNWNLWKSALSKLDSSKRAVAAAVGVDISYAHALASVDRGNALCTEKHARFAAALVINEVATGEESLDQVVSRWGAPQFLSYNGLMRGELQKLQEDVAQHMGMAALLCESAGWWPLATMFSDHAATVAAGVRRELLPLMAIDGMTAGKARALWKGGIAGPMVLATVQEEVVVKALTVGVAAQMRAKAVGPQRQQQLGAASTDAANLGTKAAKGVAHRAAKTLIAAAREHVVASVELNIAVEPQTMQEQQQEHEQAARDLEKSREIFLHNHSICTEIKLSTSDDDVMKFLTTWAQQTRWSCYLATSLPPSSKKNTSAATLAGGERILQGFSVCWDRKEAYFVDFSQRHRARELPFALSPAIVETTADNNIRDAALDRASVCTLAEAVASVMSSPNSEVIIFGALQTSMFLQAAGLELQGQLFDLEVAARLLTPSEPPSTLRTVAAAPNADASSPPSHTLKSMLDLIAPDLSREIRVLPNPRAGVTPACRSSLLLWAAADPAIRVLASRSLLDCFNFADLPATVAMTRGVCSLIKSSNKAAPLGNSMISGAALAATKTVQLSSRMLSLLDSPLFSLLPLQFGPQHVLVHTSTVQHELSTKTLTLEAAQGALVALWCTPEELLPSSHRNASSLHPPHVPAPAAPLLVIGRILKIQRGKRLRAALDFTSALDSEHQEEHNTTDEAEQRGCSVVSVAVAPLPAPAGGDPDFPAAVPLFAELVARPADQVWRLPAEAAATLVNGCETTSSAGVNEERTGNPAAATRCEVLAWHRQPPLLATAAVVPLLPQLGSGLDNQWLSIEILNIELAVLAHLSQDTELLNACSVAKPWSRVAAVWSLAAKGVTAAGGVLISAATVKAVVQFLTYGWSASRLAHELSSVIGAGGKQHHQQRISKQQASMVAASFSTAFQGLKSWQEGIISAWERSHQVSTICGRVYLLPTGAVNTAVDPKLKARQAKVAMAAVLSGSVEDVLLCAIASVNRSLGQNNNASGVLVGYQGRVVLIKVPNEKVEAVAAVIGQTLKSGVALSSTSKLAVPLDASLGAGKVLYPCFMRNIVQ